MTTPTPSSASRFILGGDELFVPWVSVTNFAGVDPTGATDSRAGLQNAIVAAIALGTNGGQGATLYFPPGTYTVSQFVFMTGANRLRLFGPGATLVYPSDNPAVVANGQALTDGMARSCFLMKYCKDTLFEELRWQGGTSIYCDALNLGVAVYERNCQRTTMRKCNSVYGGSIHQQDQQNDTGGVGDSMTVVVSGGQSTVTLVDSAGLFQLGHVLDRITISGATNQVNNGVFTVTAYISATTIQFVNPNPNAITETSSFEWIMEDGDFGTLLDNCDQDRARNIITLPSYSEVRGGTYRWPTEFLDVCGIGDELAISGSTVTLTDAAGRFTRTHQGKYIQIANATSGGNNGVFGPCTYISATSISFPNASGVTEDYPGNWWIMNGEKTGLCAGAGSISVSGTTVTVTTAENVWNSGDLGKSLLLRSAQDILRDGNWAITAVLAANQIQFDDNGSGSVSQDYSGVWSVDDWDETGAAGGVKGSIHAFYIFAGNNGFPGRSHITFDGVTFIGNRTDCIKVSGSNSPIRDIIIRGCKAFECDGFALFGADDASEHSGCTIIDNILVDCGQVHRRGMLSNEAIIVLGSRGVLIANNQFYHTREAILHQYTSTGGLYEIHAYRYTTGISQPLEDISVIGNRFTYSQGAVQSPGHICDNAIRVQQVGHLEKWATGTGTSQITLTKSGNVMTLIDTKGHFYAPEDTGKTITIVNAVSGNNGTFTISSVASQTQLSYTNAIGVASSGLTGTYRINPRAGQNAGPALICDNVIEAGGFGIYVSSCSNPQIERNQFKGMAADVVLFQNASPIVAHNRETGALRDSSAGAGTGPRLVLGNMNSWPIVFDNMICPPPTGGSNAHAWDISQTVGGASVDFPLLGKTGRMQFTDGQEEIVFAFGSGHVDGDTIKFTVASVNTTLTYKAITPGAGQFNDETSLIALINAISGLTAADYGATLAAGAIVTGHIRVRAAAPSTSDGNFQAVTATLSTSALCILYNNGNSTNTPALSVGSASAGPTPDKAVVWSPQVSFPGTTLVAPDNADARTILQAGGPAMALRTEANSGACDVMLVGDCTGKTPEFRWLSAGGA